jgi:hypothetical protein
VEFGLWRIDGGPVRLASSKLGDESRLETLLAQDISILGLGVMVVSRQVVTAWGKRIDLLAIDGEGDLYAIELKRDRTPREVVAQALDYGSWVKNIGYEEIAALFAEYSKGQPLEQAFADQFGDAPPEALNEQHHLVIVASELDASTERIVTYLSAEYGVPVNVLFFRYFVDGDHEYLARTWLIEPSEAESHSKVSKGKEPWNGQDFYVSFGDGDHRSWEDAVGYGFVSGGQGRWYSKTLEALQPGHRVFACIPGEGYVGVGTVKGTVQRVRDFTVQIDGKELPILEAPLRAKDMSENSDDAERSEYLVPVAWQKTLPRGQAIWEKGMFANQNSACALRNRFTLERLTERFDLEE